MLDYLALAKTSGGAALAIANATRGGLIEYVEPLKYDAEHPWTDTYINFDVVGGSYSETAVLYGENIGTDTLRTSFTNQSSLSGYDAEYFRFSVAGSSTSWNLNGGQTTGEYLTRLFYDAGQPFTIDNQTNYYDPRSEYDPSNNAAGVMRAHSFGTHVESTRTATVALEMMLPDENANGPTNTSRPVAITRFACSPTFQGTASFREADQYVGIGCSARGPNIRYSWEFEPGQWTPETADTLYDFPGYSTLAPNPRPIRLKARDIGTGGITSISPPSFITLRDSVLSAFGPTDVWDKTTKTYVSNRAAHWFERYNPSRTWYAQTVMRVDTFKRIWPAGDYTVELRAGFDTLGVLRRGRVSVSVSNGAMLNANTVSASNGMSAEDWGLFGGGPWLSSGSLNAPRMVRFYELMGMHDRASRFATRNWLSTLRASALDEANGFSVSTSRSTASFENTLLLDFAVARPLAAAVTCSEWHWTPIWARMLVMMKVDTMRPAGWFMPRTTPA